MSMRAIGFALAIVVIGCSGAIPEIVNTEHSLIYRYIPDSSFMVEEITLFVHITDEDGIEDIRDMYLIHDEFGLYWHLSSATWTRVNIDGVEWIGTRSIRMPDDTYVPRGRYRLEVIDRGGERDYRDIVIPQVLPIDQYAESLPTIEKRENALYLSSEYADNIVYRKLRDQGAEIIHQGAGNTIISEGGDDASARYWIYTLVESNSATILHGPFILE